MDDPERRRLLGALTPKFWPGATLLNLDDWLTMHRTITMIDFQLDAQNSYLFTNNTFIKILYMFRALPCSSSGGLRRNCTYAASRIVTLCRWLSCAPVKKELLHTNVHQVGNQPRFYLICSQWWKQNKQQNLVSSSTGKIKATKPYSLLK
jgi:hypothetical protein